MHAVEEAFDDAEGDEAADVNAADRVRVLRAPGFDAVALAEGEVELG